MKWFKFYGQDWLTDMKIRKLSVEDRLCFITLLCLACAAEEGGLVRDCDEESLIGMTNLYNDPYQTPNEYTRAVGCLKRYEALQIVTLHDNGDVTVNAFSKRQDENLSNAERQKRYRERLKIKYTKQSNKTVTPRNERYARVEKNRVEEKRATKEVFGEFKNIHLSNEEYAKLTEALGKEPTDNLIAEMSAYVASTGKKYKDYYAALQNWARRRIQNHAVKLQSTKPKMI